MQTHFEFFFKSFSEEIRFSWRSALNEEYKEIKYTSGFTEKFINEFGKNFGSFNFILPPQAWLALNSNKASFLTHSNLS